MEYKNGPVKGGSAAIRGKDDDKKLFVGGLPKNCDEKQLRETFARFGEIESVHIKMDLNTGASRGFCFIVFNDPSSVDKALKEPEIQINNKKVDPRKVTKSTTPGKIFIGGLTNEFTEEIVKEHFGKYGKITAIEWPFDKQKNQKKAYCFLTFENRDSVTDLLKKSKERVRDKELDVKKVKFNPETSWQYPGAYGAYAGRGGRGGYTASYGTPYSYSGYGYGYDYGSEYTGYDDYYYSDPYSEGYSTGYEYAPAYTTGYPRPQRGTSRPATGGYQRPAPY